MADNLAVTPGSGATVASDEATYSGDTTKIQVIRQVHVDGAEGSKTVKELVRLEDAAHTSADPGIPMLGVRQDTAASLAGTDGDYTMPIFDASGRQHVNVGTSALPTGAATSAKQDTIIGHLDGVEGLLTTIDTDTGNIDTKLGDISKAEDAAHSTGDKGVMMLAVRKDTGAAIAGTDGDYSPPQVDADGNLRVNVAAGGAGNGAVLDGVDGNIKATVLDYTNSNPLAVRLTDTSGDYVAAGAGTQYTEDAAAAANPVGGALMLVREDARAGSLTSADGDNVAARGTNAGELYVKHVDSIAVTNAGLTELAAAIDTEVQVDIVGALPAGNNAIGKLAANSGVDIGDVTLTAGTAAIGTLLPPDIDVTTHTNYAKKYYTNAGAVTDGIVWSPAAGKRWHVVSMYIQVSAAATVTLEDDKAGGDEAVWKSELAANSGAFLVFPEKYPLASGEDAADLLVTTSAGNVYITITGYEI